jgi:hypothetical protein
MNSSRSIDLHDCTVPEAIREFVSFYNSCVRSGYRGRVEVIHGYGSTGLGGAIRKELRKYLAAHAETFGEYLAGESLRNPGVTILYPGETLAPAPQGVGSMLLVNAAQEAIRKFCNTPKARERILIKLRGRFGDRVLLTEIDKMVQNGALEAMRTGDGTLQYRAIAGSE